MSGRADAVPADTVSPAAKGEAMPDTRLTPRQEEVARLILLGLTNAEVADVLHISPRTARAHADALKLRLGVSWRREIAAAYMGLHVHRTTDG